MTSLLFRRAACRISLLPSLLGILSLLLAASMAFGAAVGDQVELKARHRDGVPLHQEPHGSNGVQRVPDGTKATVTAITKDGHWLKLSLSDGRTGWVSARYIGDAAAGLPARGSSPTGTTPQRVEEGLVERVADGDTVTVIAPNQTQATHQNVWHRRSRDAQRHEIPRPTLWQGR